MRVMLQNVSYRVGVCVKIRNDGSSIDTYGGQQVSGCLIMIGKTW